jgi:hypothetical protein
MCVCYLIALADLSFGGQVMWKNEADRFGMVHMGDQVYADALTPFANATFQELLLAFRTLYRDNWSRSTMQSILRSGAHYMLPDDHEVVNNLDARQWQGSSHTVPNPPDATDAIPVPIDSPAWCALSQQQQAVHSALARMPRANLVLAGRQTFYEYQYALQADYMPSVDHLVHPSVIEDAAWRIATNAAHVTIIRARTAYVSVTTGAASYTALVPPTQPMNEFVAPGIACPTALVVANPFPVFFTRRVGATGLVFLDLRFQRTFFPDDASPLLGADQMAYVTAALAAFEEDPAITDVVLVSSVPLVFHHAVMAHLANHVDGDRYPTHPDYTAELGRLLSVVFVGQPNVAVNETVRMSKKVRLAVSGDLHHFSDANLCLEALAGTTAGYATNDVSDSHVPTDRVPGLFSIDSVMPTAVPSHCLGSMVTSGMTIGSLSATSFKLWLFTFLNVKLFAKTVSVRRDVSAAHWCVELCVFSGYMCG